MDWLSFGIGCAIGFIIGFFLAYLIRINVKKRQVNQELQKQENELQHSIYILQNEQAKQQQKNDDQIVALQKEHDYIMAQQLAELDNLKCQKLELLKSIDELTEAQQKAMDAGQQAAKNVEIVAMQAAAENIEKRAKELEKQYQDYEEKYHNDMLNMMQEAVLKYREITTNAQEESDHALQKLADLRKRVDVMVNTNRRAAQEKDKQNFYRLQLSQQDITEIAKIRSIEPYLRSAEPLNKVIWKVYYEKPCTDLIGRVIGANKKTGIYKITNLKNNMCYVGQSLDIAERWKQHIKRGIGADAPTRNKLYPAMLTDGVENFTFELLEECTPQKLNEREDYWQEVYHARDFGYSIK